MQNDDLLGILISEAIALTALIFGYRAWTGRDRGWEIIPLQTWIGSGGIPVGIGWQLIAIAAVIKSIELARVGFVVFALGLIVGLVRPRWATPPWLLKQNEELNRLVHNTTYVLAGFVDQAAHKADKPTWQPAVTFSDAGLAQDAARSWLAEQSEGASVQIIAKKDDTRQVVKLVTATGV